MVEAGFLLDGDVETKTPVGELECGVEGFVGVGVFRDGVHGRAEVVEVCGGVEEGERGEVVCCGGDDGVLEVEGGVGEGMVGCFGEVGGWTWCQMRRELISPGELRPVGSVIFGQRAPGWPIERARGREEGRKVV